MTLILEDAAVPFKEMRDDKYFYNCDRCAIEFQFGPHFYGGSPGPKGTMLCKACAPDPFRISLTSKATAESKN
ncbi:hypothetical protein [Rhizobium laguerreae]|uniref:hypothetical protein n=1 Tax=Rhizobium laguerreae TaxID=1076926 RepID=UPI001C913BC4|nr:hypothetical protein [Rhizobium laguerreae]MBY3207043.1 hypothetical protein [Rhizobium laguerreae]